MTDEGDGEGTGEGAGDGSGTGDGSGAGDGTGVGDGGAEGDGSNPATDATGDGSNVAEAFGPPDASTTALSDVADNPLATYFETAAQDSLVGFDRGCLGGWFIGMSAADPYTTLMADSGTLAWFTGRDGEAYINMPEDGANPNAYTGSQNIDPATGVQNAASLTVVEKSASGSPLLAFNVGSMDILIGKAPGIEIWSVATEYEDPSALATSGQGTTPSPVQAPAPVPATPSAVTPTPPAAQPAPVARTTESQASAPASLDWTARTLWAYDRPDPRLFQPVTSYDTGNRPLNVLVNKVLLPWRNALAFAENIPLAMVIGTDDALKSSPVRMEYQAAQDMMPLSGALGLSMEIGPALEYSAAAISSNQRLRQAATAPAYMFVGAGGVGGSVPAASKVAPSSLGAAKGASALGAEVQASLGSAEIPSTAAAANYQHVITGGSGGRGIGVLHIDVAGLAPAEVKSTAAAVKDMDFQAGIADGLVRTAVPTRTVANNVARLGRKSLGLGSSEAPGHLPDVAGGGSPLGPIMGMDRGVNQSIGGQWNRYSPGFKFDGFSLVNRATGEFIYMSQALEHEPMLILDSAF